MQRKERYAQGFNAPALASKMAPAVEGNGAATTFSLDWGALGWLGGDMRLDGLEADRE